MLPYQFTSIDLCVEILLTAVEKGMDIKHDPWSYLLLESFVDKVVGYAMNVFLTNNVTGNKKVKKYKAKNLQHRVRKCQKLTDPL